MLKRIIAGVIILIVLTLVYTVANANSIVKTQYKVLSSKVQDNIRILFISDIHYGCVQGKSVVKNALSKLQQEYFDVVILGGDIVQCPVTSKSDMVDIISELGKLQSKYGIYFVYGNHDAKDDGTAFDSPRHDDIYNSEDLTETLRDNGIYVLNDNVALLGNKISIIGRANSLDSSERIPIEDIAVNSSTFTICVDHTPIDMKDCSRSGVDLQISGHTHGGQLFPINILEPIIWDMPSYGMRVYGNMKLIVSSGMGIGAYPLRNVHHCEYVVIDVMPDSR